MLHFASFIPLCAGYQMQRFRGTGAVWAMGNYHSITEPRSGSDRVQSVTLKLYEILICRWLRSRDWTRSLPLLGSVIEWQRSRTPSCISASLESKWFGVFEMKTVRYL